MGMKIITGSGRCGTSVLAKILAGCGIDVGTDQWHGEYRAGLEHPRLESLNNQILHHCNKKWKDGFYFLTKKQSKNVAAIMEKDLCSAANEVAVGKDPRFSVTLETWVLAKTAIDYVVICIRDHFHAALSAQDTGAAMPNGQFEIDEIYRNFMARTGNLLYVVEKHKIPYTVVVYPNDFQRGLSMLASVFSLDSDKLRTVCGRVFKI